MKPEKKKAKSITDALKERRAGQLRREVAAAMWEAGQADREKSAADILRGHFATVFDLDLGELEVSCVELPGSLPESSKYGVRLLVAGLDTFVSLDGHAFVIDRRGGVFTCGEPVAAMYELWRAGGRLAYWIGSHRGKSSEAMLLLDALIWVEDQLAK